MLVGLDLLLDHGVEKLVLLGRALVSRVQSLIAEDGDDALAKACGVTTARMPHRSHLDVSIHVHANGSESSAQLICANTAES